VHDTAFRPDDDNAVSDRFDNFRDVTDTTF
jgi:hypothetical protein